MKDLWPKTLVVLRAAPTYLAVVTLVVTVLADELIPLLPEAIGAQIAGYAVAVLAIVAAIVRVISRVTPVEPAARGLLPPPVAPDQQ